jgi:N6-adenosine-specific RNA methylase IME4
VGAKYATIVADPPWQYGKFGGYSWREGRASGKARPLPYPSMTVAEITALPVRDLAANDAHLYLWTTQRYLRDAYDVAAAWGFKPSCTLVWCKQPRGFSVGGTFQSNVEFVLFCRRGSLAAKQRVTRQWFEWPRAAHSQKPEHFLDMVEQTSPGPYLELFSRRRRLGWDVWGNQVESTIALAAD